MFSGECFEAPHVKLLTQIPGDHSLKSQRNWVDLPPHFGRLSTKFYKRQQGGPHCLPALCSRLPPIPAECCPLRFPSERLSDPSASVHCFAVPGVPIYDRDAWMHHWERLLACLANLCGCNSFTLNWLHGGGEGHSILFTIKQSVSGTYRARAENSLAGN